MKRICSIEKNFDCLRETKKAYLNSSFESISSSVVEEWAERTGGWKTQCNKIAYGKPTRAESQDGSSSKVESSRVT